jgi:hypothetical protein
LVHAVEGGFGLAVEAHKCRHREHTAGAGMGLQGLEVTASSSKKVYPSPFVVLRLAKLLGKLLGKVFRNSSRAGWTVGDSTQHACMLRLTSVLVQKSH